jgi:haloalkane dehalogenase
MNSYNPQVFPFRSRWINIKGNKVHYVDEGQGEIILFFHPPVASSFMYRNMIKILQANYRCVALDFPGFGLSSVVGGFQYSLESLSEIVEMFIRELELRNFYVLVQEVGGHAALAAIMKKPEDVKGFILTDTIIFPLSQYPKIARMLNVVNGVLFNLINSNFNLVIKVATTYGGFGQRKLTKVERVTYEEMFNTKAKRRLVTKLLHELATQGRFMQKIQMAFETTFSATPTLLVYGEKDPLTQLGIPQRIKMMLRNAELHLIKGEKHFPHEGAPEIISEIISEWLLHQRLLDLKTMRAPFIEEKEP